MVEEQNIIKQRQIGNATITEKNIDENDSEKPITAEITQEDIQEEKPPSLIWRVGSGLWGASSSVVSGTVGLASGAVTTVAGAGVGATKAVGSYAVGAACSVGGAAIGAASKIPGATTVGSVVGTVGGAAVGAVCTVGGVAASGTGKVLSTVSSPVINGISATASTIKESVGPQSKSKAE